MVSISASPRYPPVHHGDDGDDEDNGGFIRTPKRVKRERRRAAREAAALRAQQQPHSPPPSHQTVTLYPPSPSHELTPAIPPNSPHKRSPELAVPMPEPSNCHSESSRDSDGIRQPSSPPKAELEPNPMQTSGRPVLDSEDANSEHLSDPLPAEVHDMEMDFMINNGSQLPMGVDVVAVEIDVDIRRVRASLDGLKKARAILDEEILSLEDTLAGMLATRSLHVDRNMSFALGGSWDPYIRA